MYLEFPMLSADEFVEWANFGEDINMKYHEIIYWVGPTGHGIKMMNCGKAYDDNPNEMVVKDARELLEHYMIEGKPLKEILSYMTHLC